MVGKALILVFASTLKLLPASGARRQILARVSPAARSAREAGVPAFALAVPMSGQMTRIVVPQWSRSWIRTRPRTARGAGIPEVEPSRK